MISRCKECNKKYIEKSMLFHSFGLLMAIVMLFSVSILCNSSLGQQNPFFNTVAKITNNKTPDESTALDSQELLRLKMLMPAGREGAAERYKAARSEARSQARAAAPGAVALMAVPAVADPGGIPHYYGPYPNYANSPLPKGGITSVTVTSEGSGYSSPIVTIEDLYGTGSGATVNVAVLAGKITGINVSTPGSGYSAPFVNITDATGLGAAATATIDGSILTGGIRKFVDSLPGLNAAKANNLGQYIPVAIPDTTTYPGCDYYEIELNEYSEKLHSDLPATRLRGYRQTNTNNASVKKFHYAGPLIVAERDVPVRIKFTNNLPTGDAGDLFLPVDTSVMGAGMGPLDMMGMPGMKENYTENRATVHLHGGYVPWISDGTPHQWTTPANETTQYPKGVSVRYVPDMWFVNGAVVSNTVGQTTPPVPGASNNPGNGSLTFYYNNQQSARLMFYHDHAYGITRLNVYAGEAAGYLVTDQVDQDLIAGTNVAGVNPTLNKVLPDVGIPLIIQDKSFVDNTTITAQDPTWNWGTGAKVAGKISKSMTGDLWYPHVYMPNQNPADVGGMNAFGRWHFGPWFWPPTLDIKYPPIANPYYPNPDNPMEYSLIPAVPQPSMAMEAFMDTPVVNGALYPNLTVEPKAYRFRILNAADDRFFNLQLYRATGIVSSINLTDGGSNYTYAPMVSITGGGGMGATAKAEIDPASGKVVAINLLTVGSGYTSAPTVNITGNAKATAAVYTKPTEVGMIPASICTAGLPPEWPTDGRDGGVPDPTTRGPMFIQIGSEGGFLPKPVVLPNQPVNWNMDQTNFDMGVVNQGTLILGTAERADVIVDFSKYANETLILYNDAPAPFPAIDPRYDYYTGHPDLTDTGGAPKTQPGYGPNTRTIMQIKVLPAVIGPDPIGPDYMTNKLPALEAIFANTTGKKGVFNASQDQIIVPQAEYNSAYNASFPADPYVRIYEGFKNFTTVSGAWANITFEPKAIQDEMGETYDVDYGRMSAMLGLQLPVTAGVQQFTMYPYPSPPVEIVKDSIYGTPIGITGDGTQIWKITHNGVDTHTVHVHLFNAQLINRVAWDNALRVPDLNELGWKETFRVNPLQDTLIALRPTAPDQPFEIPNSTRPIDPTTPLGDPLRTPPGGFKDPTGEPVTIFNHLVNFGWEYVWHCHLLAHEEMDMMHSMSFAVAPWAPTNLTAAGIPVTLSWKDNSISETGFRIQRATDAGFTQNLTSFTVGQNVTTYIDTSALAGTTYFYRVQAINVVGDTFDYAGPAFPTEVVYSAWSNTATTASAWKSGQTVPGATNWKAYYGDGIYVDVDTSSAGFTSTPRYFTSLGGATNQLLVQGITAIYSATPNGFRIYLWTTNRASLTPAMANSYKWYVQWLAVPTTDTNAGSTPKGATNWIASGGNAIYVDVDTSAAGFASTPRYFTSLGGNTNHLLAQGITAIYSPTPNGFRIYLRNSDGSALTPAIANSYQWHVQWLGVPTSNVKAGSTPKGSTNWIVYSSDTIYVNPDTSTAGFTATPRYFTSLGGNTGHWAAHGVNAIYSATSNGFRVFLRSSNRTALTPTMANNNGWHVQWLGVPALTGPLPLAPASQTGDAESIDPIQVVAEFELNESGINASAGLDQVMVEPEQNRSGIVEGDKQDQVVAEDGQDRSSVIHEMMEAKKLMIRERVNQKRIDINRQEN